MKTKPGLDAYFEELNNTTKEERAEIKRTAEELGDKETLHALRLFEVRLRFRTERGWS